MSSADRKKTFIDPQVQGALVKRLVIHWCSFIAVAASLAFCLQVLSNPFQPMKEHFQQIWWTHGPFLVVMVFMLPAFVFDTIKLSHRFAGPIYRLRSIIRDIAKGGEVKRLKFRDFDFWQGLAEDFNVMTNKLQNREAGEETDSFEPELEVTAK